MCIRDRTIAGLLNQSQQQLQLQFAQRAAEQKTMNSPLATIVKREPVSYTHLDVYKRQEIVLVELDSAFLRAGLVAVLVALGARMFAVGAPLTLFPRWFHLPKGAWKVLAWGGLRGGISVALALSLPASAERNLSLIHI